MALTPEGERWRHLKYVSMRLAKSYLDVIEATDTAASLGLKASGEVLPGVNLDADLSPPSKRVDRTNPVAVARALDEQLANTYVNLAERPDPRRISSGTLIKASLLFQPAHLQVQGYELVTPTRDPYFVVAFSSLDFVHGLGRVFIGLVGSEHDLLSFPGDGIVGARAASNSDGLYQMIQYTKEAADGPDIDPERLSTEHRRYGNATLEDRIQAVAETFNGFALSAAPRPMDVLFEVHHVARDVDLEALRVRTDGGGRVGLALFGAPIWIREATDRTLLSSADVVEDVGSVHETWEQFDEELRRSIRDERHATTWKADHATDFRLLGQWAVAWAKRVCPPLQRRSTICRTIPIPSLVLG